MSRILLGQLSLSSTFYFLPLPLASAGSNVSVARGFSGCKEDVAVDVDGHLVAVASKPGSWLCH